MSGFDPFAEYLAARAAVRLQNDRARKLGVFGVLVVNEWLLLKTHFNERCVCCQMSNDFPRVRLSIDHVIAISHGGANVIENVQPLCIPCNTHKHTRPIDYRDPALLHSFLRELAKLRG